MTDEPTNARKSFGDIAPHLATITDKVLFGDVWENEALSLRDRSLVTISTLIAMYRTNEMPFHLKKALVLLVADKPGRSSRASSPFT